MYGIGYSLGRFWIEGLRTDSLMLGNIRVAQLISIILIIGCIYLMNKLKNEKKPE
jgi:prolipoprotein diacylglyceryltransferase